MDHAGGVHVGERSEERLHHVRQGVPSAAGEAPGEGGPVDERRHEEPQGAVRLGELSGTTFTATVRCTRMSSAR